MSEERSPYWKKERLPYWKPFRIGNIDVCVAGSGCAAEFTFWTGGERVNFTMEVSDLETVIREARRHASDYQSL